MAYRCTYFQVSGNKIENEKYMHMWAKSRVPGLFHGKGVS
jgi:hypothetical protein